MKLRKPLAVAVPAVLITAAAWWWLRNRNQIEEINDGLVR